MRASDTRARMAVSLKGGGCGDVTMGLSPCHGPKKIKINYVRRGRRM